MSEELKRINYGEKVNLVNHIFHMYKKIILFEKAFKNKDRLNVESMVGNKAIIEIALSMLSEEHSLIIRNDFLTEQKTTEWYLGYFCKTKYYKLRQDAVNALLENIFI